MVEPHFKMLWAESIPHLHIADGVSLRCIAGEVAGLMPPSPPPNSWASHSDSNLAIWLIDMAPNSSWTFPDAPNGAHRSLYAVQGDSIALNSQHFPLSHVAFVQDGCRLTVSAGSQSASLLLLQANPIGEPVVQYGPFVMNSKAEIQQAFMDYQRTGFGGWPWQRDDPVHDPKQGRFAMHSDGQMDMPS